MSSVSAAGYAGYNPFVISPQNLFTKIDSNGDGSITKTELEQAVTTAGGSTQGADALYAKLDPNNTGSVSEQQFSQNLPPPPFSDQMGAQMIGFQSSGWPGSSGTAPGGQFAQSLFSQIDSNGDGSITKSELEKAVTSAGGTIQAADALYAKLDPNNTGSVSEQQFAQTLSQARPHHHHHDSDQDDASKASSPQGALSSLLSATNGASSPAQLAQNLFSQIDTNSDGSISKSELEQAVTSTGGTTQGADALYAQLDPNNTGSVSEQQLAQYLQPPSPTGNTAQDALLALTESAFQSASNGSLTSVSGISGTASSNGNTAQDALSALVQNFASNQANSTNGSFAQGNSAQDAFLSLIQNLDPTQFGNSSMGQDPLLSLLNGSGGASTLGLSTSGNTAQDALFALMQANNAGNSNGNGNSSTAGSSNSANLALALSLYQNQMDQQMYGSMFGTGSKGA